MNVAPLRIFFPNLVDQDNFNAQSLNVREIALRLDPDRFRCTLFYARKPDNRLRYLSHIHLFRIPPRCGSLYILWRLFSGHDILFSPGLSSRFTSIYFNLTNFLGQREKVIYWIEGQWNKSDPVDFQKRIARFKQKIDTYVGITCHVARTSEDGYGIRVCKVIPVGVNTSVFTPAFRSNSERPRVIFVGHLIERKGPHLVLKAARAFPKADFWLIGEARGGYQYQLRSMIKANQLNNVEFFDPMPQGRLAQMMSRSDILLHPSRVEGMPKVVLEGAATGLPAIIFDEYQAPVVMDRLTGYQVQTFEEMLHCLGQLIENRDLRLSMGAAAAEHAKQFDWEVIVKQWEELFEKTIWESNGANFSPCGSSYSS